ncbi:phytanoyl-CoA dioxygenase [Kipferlia bialata]|uniref:Phytanoyl-CoA dioxygenase n=1 Tax=Kipferlia bialata TaxID=797122 RepID=A0A391NLN6_9EUKA|nr:phytanoyl-CoA dioxygenase [Kipferlia bialata]|eukprot:g5978.t1
MEESLEGTSRLTAGVACLGCRAPHAFDASEEREWLACLATRGYGVIRSVAPSPDAVSSAQSQVWDHLEAQSRGTLLRGDIDTWDKHWPVQNCGICWTAGQSQAMWSMRGWAKVQQVFAAVWGMDELVTSFDGFIVWRPWCDKEAWKPKTSRLHLDQNPWYKEGKLCVQGMVQLCDSSARVGGLQVVEGSHLENMAIRDKNPQWKASSSDWCETREGDPLNDRAHLVLANKGDMILWDSRTVHGGVVGDVGSACSDTGLARMVGCVCMLPRERCTSDVLARRLAGFKKGVTCNHWADEYHASGYASSHDYSPPDLSEETTRLI